MDLVIVFADYDASRENLSRQQLQSDGVFLSYSLCSRHKNSVVVISLL